MKKHTLYTGIMASALFLGSSLFFSACSDEDIIDSSTNFPTGEGIFFGTSIGNGQWTPDVIGRSAKEEKQKPIVIEGEDGFSITATVEDGIKMRNNEAKPQSRGTQVTQAAEVTEFDVAAYKNVNGTYEQYFTERVTDGVNPSEKRYWPSKGTVDFIATYPQGIFDDQFPTAAEYADGFSFNYTVKDNVEEQEDIMVAWPKGLNNGENGEAVDLQFQHLLAAVQFKVGILTACHIKSITLSGVYTGEYSYTYNEGENGVGYWTAIKDENNERTKSFTFDYDNVYTTIESENMNEGDDLTGNSNSTMLLLPPQALNNAKVTVVYDNLLEDKGEVTKEASLTGQWTAGKTYAYALNISTDLNITIPRPQDQDAHYVMVKMKYDISEISNDISEISASVEYINNTATTNIKPTLKFIGDLTDLQKKGYWTEYQYTVVDNTDGTDSYTNPVNIRGTEVLELGTIKEDSIVMFLPENNGETDRDVVLKITGKYNSKNITIGSGTFKQLCPSWSEDKTIGIERFEEKDKDGNILKHPWGFKWDRKAEYQFSAINIFLPYIFSNQFSYTGSYYTITEYNLWVYQYMYVNIDYTLLNNINGATNSDGLVNTKDLFNSTGTDGGVSELETFCKSYTSLIGSKFELKDESGSTTIPKDFAAYEALKRNKFSEGLRGEDSENEIFAIIFENDMQWYLPSTTEALKLREISEDTDPLSTTEAYWSSNRHTVSTEGETEDNTKAYAITFNSNGNCTFNATDRMENLRIRAVRKKSTTTTN